MTYTDEELERDCDLVLGILLRQDAIDAANRIIADRNRWKESSDSWKRLYDQAIQDSHADNFAYQGAVAERDALKAEVERLSLLLEPDSNPCMIKDSRFCKEFCRLYKEGCYDLF